MHTFVAPRLFALLVSLASAFGSASVRAEEPPQAAPATRHTSRAGDTLEKIAARHYAGSPLHSAVLVRQLQEANASTLGNTGPRKRLKPGTVLEIPSHAQMLRKAVGPHLPADAFASAPATDPQARKHWVHYP